MRTAYDFRNHDPIIDQLCTLVLASRVPIPRLADRSGVPAGTINRLIRLHQGRGNKWDVKSTTIKFKILARITYGLGHSLRELEGMNNRRHLKLAASKRLTA